MKIFFSVGEPSGDLHGANLVRELRRLEPSIECIGYGGPRMQEAGCKLDADLTQFAVMWILRVLTNIHHFYRLWRQADEHFERSRPDAVVLIDYPGFNWWIARSAKRRGIPVFYYGVPQMWAWAGWRVKKMRRLVDHALCKLPFEADWFNRRDCPATYVGHPYFDEVRQRALDREFLVRLHGDGKRITILPGSRPQEVLSNLPTFLLAAKRVLETSPNTKFAVASFNEKQAAIAREMIRGARLPIEVHVGKTPELIQAAHACLACSGSVSLELLHHEKPTVIVYKVSRSGMFVQRFFRKVSYITLVNLLATKDRFPERVTVYDPDASGAEQVPFPEYLTSGDKSAAIAAHLVKWLDDSTAYEARVKQLQKLKQRYGQPGATARAARFILHTLAGRAAAAVRSAKVA